MIARFAHEYFIQLIKELNDDLLSMAYTFSKYTYLLFGWGFWSGEEELEGVTYV